MWTSTVNILRFLIHYLLKMMMQGNDINNEEEYIESELFEIYEKKFMEEFLTTAFQLGVNAMRNSNFINESNDKHSYSNVKNEQVVTKIDFMDYQQNKCKGLNKER